MAALLVIALICVHSLFNNGAGANEIEALVSHLADKGTSVAKLPWKPGQVSKIKNFVDFFHVNDGDVVVAKELSELVHQTLPITIEHTLGVDKWFHALQVKITPTPSIVQQKGIFSRSEYDGSVLENQQLGTNVKGLQGLLNTTREVTYELVPNEDKAFTFVYDTSEDGNLHPSGIATTKVFDREIQSRYTLVIRAQQGDLNGIATINISIDDENDNVPSFPKYEYMVTIDYADVISGSPVLSIPATDRDIDVIHYCLNPNNVFDVDGSGNIFVEDISKIQTPNHELELVAFDSNNQQSIPVHITITIISDLKFVPQHRRVRRQTENTVSITIDEGASNIYSFEPPGFIANYRIVRSSIPDLFRIDGRNVVIQSNKKLDYEVEGQRSMNVVVQVLNGTDVFENKTIQITLTNVNDEPPYFISKPEPFQATVSQTTAEGTKVFTLVAVDPDGPLLASVEYYLISGGESRFAVGKTNGWVTVVGSTSFERGHRYYVNVEARDVRANPVQKTTQKIVEVLVGEREPQFFEPAYTVNVPENSRTPYLVETIKARPFQGAELRYELRDNLGGDPSAFTITSEGPQGGEVKLIQTLNFEDPTQPKEYNLRVVATEMVNDGLSSTVKLVISVTDINDNDPQFPLSTYIEREVPESAVINTPILNVTATDQDSGKNAELTFTVDNPLFAADTLGNSGIIKVNGRLDYDRMVGHRYEFLVIATDQGESPRTGSATVIVLVTNVNDEDPVFSTDLKADVFENANKGQYVHTVHVTDPDGDNVKVYFLDGNGQRSVRFGAFEITPETGRVFLRETLPSDVNYYALNLTAEDDGSCCSPSGVTRTSTGTLIVEIVDVNDNRPEFYDCLNYQSNPPSVKENSPIGSSVFQVHARDLDQGENGMVTYAFLTTSSVNKFNINSTSGLITVAQAIDRETQDGARDIGITVEASDHGTPRLNGICSFRILVDDVNDNPPVFTTPVYSVQIETSAPVDKSIIRLVANDLDSGDNSRVEYLLIENLDSAFQLNNETGVVRLIKTLEGMTNIQALKVMAKDHGKPERLNTTARVTFTIMANAVPPPVFLGDIATTPVLVNETQPLGSLNPVAKIRASTTTNDRVNFLLITDTQEPVTQIDPFVIFRPPGLDDEMHLYLRSRLDFEQKESYQLKIRAAVQSANSDIIVTINVIDQNDEYPSFRGYNPAALTINGTLTENRNPGQTVVTLQAIDSDKSPQFRRLRFSFWDDDEGIISTNFSINADTGEIKTKTVFDLESHLPSGMLRFTVKVDDRVPSADPSVQPGMPNSATATVEVQILDVNDNNPKFDQKIYKAAVLEDVDIGHPVLTLGAKDLDKDSQMEFSITSAGNDFTVERRTGIVRVANLLDFEDLNRRFYNVTVQVYDGIHSDTAYMEITVEDANDNAPSFTQNPYQVTNIYENDTRVQIIVRVEATDPDTDRDNDIEYSLNGPLSDDGTFLIDRKTGEITVTRALDRDYPDGQRVYEFNVLAVDEPTMSNKRTGVSYVRVFPIDINDNSPVFDTKLLEGSVLEHSSAFTGARVFAVNAVDYDEGINAVVEYTIVQQEQANELNIFGINKDTGQINVVTVNSSVLDREKKPSYTITVRATDKGPRTPLSQPTDQLITINLEDINDQKPVFSQTIYKVVMTENLSEDVSVTSVTASDSDEGINAQLIYSLERNVDKEYFKMDTRNATNEGILRIFKTNKIDYENPNLRFFNVTVSVDDVPSPNHKVLAYIEVTVEDFNDNAPVFERPSITARFYENITVGLELATFKATDADSGDNKLFEYSIDHGPNSDPLRQFRIDELGVVRLNKPLDRERNASHNVQILAIDKGTPPNTGQATLAIEVLDVNDNAPDFAEDYVVYFEENENRVQTWPDPILAKDPDTARNGPPFHFSLPCNYACCPENPYCKLFNMTFSNDAPYPDGSGRVRTTLRSFDREFQAEYYLPIVMWDSGEPVMTGTRLLHIVIKDKNDNHHEAALKKILVYSYEGFRALENVAIGRVYAKDPDDWDVVDKDFSVVGDPPEYFRVNKESGMILMSGKPPEGLYRFEVGVFDKHWNEMVQSAVEITVRGIPSAAVYSSGSIRFDGISSRDFLERPHAANGAFGQYDPSKYDKFKAELAKKLNVPENNVEIFSVRDNADGSADIRFAAHGSPWYKSSKLDGLVTTNKVDFEKNVGIKIGMVPIDECVYEICDHGCYNKYFVSDEPMVIAGNSTSFVGVDAYMKQECNTCNSLTASTASDCTCKAGEYPATCENDFCYNGGTCYMDDWNEMRCKCDEGFDGSRCQQTKHSFKGDGWALYPAFAQCEFGQTSLEFITTRSDSLIFYNGAMDRNGEQDFISLELRNGAPYLRIDHGTGTLNLSMDQLRLADNQWHRIDITSAGKMITLTVDSCMTAVITEDADNSNEDRSSCEVSGKTPGENKFLNVNTLLQMGGTFAQPPFIPTGLNGFSGCIKNFKHLGLLYDLYMGSTGLHQNTEDGCPQEVASCGSENSVEGLVCGKNGICIGNLNGGKPTCVCKPGWMANKCETETPSKDFKKESYIAWEVSLTTQPERNKLQVNFRTRDQNGVLFTAMSASRAERLTLQIRDKYLQAVFYAKSSMTVKLDKVMASNGHWHTAYLERFGRHMKLYMDSGEGPYFAESTGLPSTRQTFVISKNDVYGGAIVSGTKVEDPDLNDYNNSCLADVRLEEIWFPMDKNVIANGVRAITTLNVEDGCVRDDCEPAIDCGLNRVCVPLWGAYACKCKPGFVEGKNSTCVSACRCENGGTCMYTAKVERGYTCTCPREYTGVHCETEVSSLYREASLSPEGMAAILVCVFLLLLLLFAVFLYVRLKKPKDKLMLDDDPYDDIRENVVNYDEDGAGEEDQNAFDITRIRVPLDSAAPVGKVPYENMPRRVDRPLQSSLPPGELPDVGNFISGRLKDADDDFGAPPHDSVREFVNEGGGSDAGSLSSLNTSTSSGDQDYDYLNEWGPKFAKLADMYGAGQTDED